VFIRRELSYNLIQLPCHDQVFTGILPYDDNNKGNVITDIRRGKRPSRPTSPSQNQWLQDPVWDTITTCWSRKPQQRCELSVVYHIFSKSGRRPVLNAKLGGLNTQTNRNVTMAEEFQDYSSVEKYSHESPLSSSLCEFRSQRSRDLLMKWIKHVPPPLHPLLPSQG
jgi:hypothetical protein